MASGSDLDSGPVAVATQQGGGAVEGHLRGPVDGVARQFDDGVGVSVGVEAEAAAGGVEFEAQASRPEAERGLFEPGTGEVRVPFENPGHPGPQRLRNLGCRPGGERRCSDQEKEKGGGETSGVHVG